MNREELVALLFNNLERVTVLQAVYNLTAALLCTAIIFAVYYFTAKDTSPTALFAKTLLIVTLSITLLVMLIGSNLALSLGMVGALSVIRFRAAVKDSRDAAFILFAIAAGMSCALSVYMFALVATLFIAVTILLFSFLNIGARTYLITVRTSKIDPGCEEEIKKAVGKRYSVIAVASINDDTQDIMSFETIFEVGLKKDADTLCARILEIDGVTSVSAVLREDG